MNEPEPAGPMVPDLRLRGDPPRVMRLSRRALIALALLASAGIGGSLFWALRPAHRQAAEELFSSESRSPADSVTSAPKDYGEVPRLGPPLPGDLGRPIVAAQQRGVVVSPPPSGPWARSGPTPPAAARQAARQRPGEEREGARLSKLFLGGVRSAEAAPAPAIPLQPLSGSTGPVATAAPGQSVPVDQAGQGDQAGKRAFLTNIDGKPVASVNRLEHPVSPYVLQAGSVIAAALITGIRSDLPGQVTAQVTQNVYDSATGRILLIAQGAKLIGDYDSQISFGQDRLLLAWDRLLLPDGRSILLDRQPGTDAAGRAGLQDRTNQHWGGVAGAALLSTLLGIGAEVGSDNDGDLVRAVRRGTSQTVNQAGDQIVRRQLGVRPTLTIRPGYPVRVLVTRDLVLAPAEQGNR